MTSRIERRSTNWSIAACLGAMVACGCSPPPTPTPTPTGSAADTERYVPSPAQSETALRAVFEAWRQGTPPGAIPETSPEVFVTDTYRKADETLVDYRILGEVPSDKKRCYAVELRYAPERAERTRFLVVGIEPLWVFRLEDAENLAHWEHNPGPSEPESQAPPGETAPESAPPEQVPPDATQP